MGQQVKHLSGHFGFTFVQWEDVKKRRPSLTGLLNVTSKNSVTGSLVELVGHDDLTENRLHV